MDHNRPIAICVAVLVDDDRFISFRRAALFDDGFITIAVAMDLYAAWANPDSHFIGCRRQHVTGARNGHSCKCKSTYHKSAPSPLCTKLKLAILSIVPNMPGEGEINVGDIGGAVARGTTRQHMKEHSFYDQSFRHTDRTANLPDLFCPKLLFAITFLFGRQSKVYE